MSLKAERDIYQMRKAGLLTWASHKLVSDIITTGMTTAELDREVERLYLCNGAIPLFKGYPGRVPYPATICCSINEQIVHGIPSAREIQDGDIVSVDTGCKIDGWCGDSANTYMVGKVDDQSKKLVETTRGTLKLAIKLLKTKRLWSDVAREMERFVKKDGFSVVEMFVGHGVGREMHEEPQVPNYVYREFIMNHDFPIRPGLVIAIEPMVNAGSKKVRTGHDLWTISTADGSRSAHAEHTVGILKSGPYILTGEPLTEEEKKLSSEFFEKYEDAKAKGQYV